MRQEERVTPTPERLAKGGLRIHSDDQGNYLSCLPEPDTVLAVLIERGKLEPVMQDFADEFWEMKRAFLSPVRYKSRTNEPGDSPSFVAATRYRHVCKGMKRATLILAENASTPEWVPETILPVATYRLAFDRLADAIRDAHKEVTAKVVAQEMAKLAATDKR